MYRLIASSLLLVIALAVNLSFAVEWSTRATDAITVIQAIPSTYPSIAGAARASGEPVVEATVDTKGAVTSVETVSGHKLLEGAYGLLTRFRKSRGMESGLEISASPAS